MDKNTHLIFTADHGAVMGENGVLQRQEIPINSLIHVPYIWKPPATKKSGLIIAEKYTEHVDLAPTILELASISIPKEIEGKSFSSVITEGSIEKINGKDSAYSEICQVVYNNKSQKYDWKINKYFTSIIFEDWHYLHSPDIEYCALYDLKTDPHEQINLYNEPNFQTQLLKLKTILINRIISDNHPREGLSLKSWKEWHGRPQYNPITEVKS